MNDADKSQPVGKHRNRRGRVVKPVAPIEPTKEVPKFFEGTSGVNSEAMILLRRAVTNGWDVSDSVWKEAPAKCEEFMLDPTLNKRDRLRAIEVLTSMVRDKVNAAIALDKVTRLENGTPTEAVTFLVKTGVPRPGRE